MSGLDNIVRSISREAEEKAAEIIEQARRQAEEIDQKSAAKKEDRVKAIKRKAEAEKEAVLARYASEDGQLRRQALLRAKSTLIEEIIAQAKSRILDLPQQEYFALMRRLVQKNALPGDGLLYFATGDFERMPGDFEQTLGIENGTVRLAGSTDSIAHGFVIAYGKIEQNCSLDSIFESERNRMVDAVSACLKKEAGEENG